MNSVKALRGAFVAIDEGKVSEYSGACFKAYWVDDKDISQEDVLREIVAGVGMDADAFFAKIGDDAIKRKLFETTDDLIARGGFGSPTFFLDRDDMYFGNDRLEVMQAGDRPEVGLGLSRLFLVIPANAGINAFAPNGLPLSRE